MDESSSPRATRNQRMSRQYDSRHMIFTVPTGPSFAKNRPRLSSVILEGKLPWSQPIPGLTTYDEKVCGLPISSVTFLERTS